MTSVTPFSGTGMSRMRRDRMSPMEGPPRQRRISLDEPPSSETAREINSGGIQRAAYSPGRTNAQSLPNAWTKSLAAVPPEMTM